MLFIFDKPNSDLRKEIWLLGKIRALEIQNRFLTLIETVI